MVQAAMYFVLGVLTAGLLALLVMPAIWRRTARLTRQRLESSVPMTMAEIQADRDQLRAEFAISARKLELTVDRLRDKTTEQVIEINEKRAEIVRLTNENNEKGKTIEGLEERAARLVADLAAVDDRLSDANERIRQREATITQRDAEITDLRARLLAVQELADEQKLELVARETEIGNLNDRLADAKTIEGTLAMARDKLAEELAAEQSALAAERRRVANLEASLARLEAERIDRLGELERRAAEVRELVAELAKSRSDAEDLAARLTELQGEPAVQQLDSERRTGELEADSAARRYLGNGVPPSANENFAEGDNVAKAIAAAEAEKASLAERLAALEVEHATLREQNEQLRRVASAEWDIESENALLRERLAGVAADVLRLTDTFGEGGPRPAENGSTNGGNGAEPHHREAEAALSEAGGRPKPVESRSLAERLRALQHTAARH